MSAQLRRRSATAKSNQFIRPNIVSVDTVSAAQRLALRGSGFGASDEVATKIAAGMASELADELMAALGSCFDTLSG